MATRRPRRREKQVLACRHCGRVFEGRANALHCSERCRQAAWRAKRGEALKTGRNVERDQRLRDLVVVLAKEVGLRVEDST